MEKEKRVTIKNDGSVVVVSDNGVIENGSEKVVIEGDYVIDTESLQKLMLSKLKASVVVKVPQQIYSILGEENIPVNTLITSDDRVSKLIEVLKMEEKRLHKERDDLKEARLSFGDHKYKESQKICEERDSFYAYKDNAIKKLNKRISFNNYLAALMVAFAIANLVLFFIKIKQP